MQHLIAFAASVLSSGTFQAITPVPDPTVFINGTLLNVPDKLNQVLAAFALTKANSAGTKAQLQSPSLRAMFFPTIAPLNLATTFEGMVNFFDLGDNPIQLVTNEGLQFFNDGGGNGTTAQDVYGIVILGDSKVAPANGKIYTMRATAAVALAARTFVNGALTFDQNLPVGNYDIVGMRARGTGLVAARLVFIGASAVSRAGVPAVADAQGNDFSRFRFGNNGVFGTFNSLTPPSVDCLGDTGTAQVFEFDLIPR